MIAFIYRVENFFQTIDVHIKTYYTQTLRSAQYYKYTKLNVFIFNS